jgi:predicted DNA-binding protein (UPF0251 family)
MPENQTFSPHKQCGRVVTLSVEELEAVRLCDLESLEQDDAATSMNISRATFQRILYEARKKIADALWNGKAIEIGGGNYELAQHPCRCRRRCTNCIFDKKMELDNGRQS